ncbi:MAG: GNAT family N-acetyltransferase, partial [Kangiellaceae bacterium]
NNEDQTFSSALTELINNYEVYRRNALLICDGLGVKRLQAQFRRLAESTEPNSRKNGRFFRCRLAEQADVELVFLWQKLPETRRFALNPKIPSYKEHVAWMEAKLNSTDNYFYIIEVRKTNNEVQQAGVLRLDKIDKCSGLLVSVFIEPEQHGKGLAGQALSEIISLHGDSDLFATILDKNIASRKLFLRAGFKPVGNQNYIKPSS